MSNLDDFRKETRAWLEENCPASMRDGAYSLGNGYWGGKKTQPKHPDEKLWCDRMAAKGWTVPDWPVEYGGGGLSGSQVKILREEMHTIGARLPLEGFGVWMLGPALLAFGTEEQKREHLTKIAKGEVWWCQGYSEPNAGSDLASLQTKAEDAGDHYIVNGQKIWTSYADQADWIFCLVRTDGSGKKQEGISFLLIDMDQPGVEPKPIKLISGSSPFCETFFDNAKADKKNLVGELGKGWSVAKYLLSHERDMLMALGMSVEEPLSKAALVSVGTNSAGKISDAGLRNQIAQYEVDSLCYDQAVARVKEEVRAGRELGGIASVMKYYGSELNKRRSELELSIHGESALGWEGDIYEDGKIPKKWLRTKGNSIEGGTSEIQLNIISKRVLGLPDS